MGEDIEGVKMGMRGGGGKGGGGVIEGIGLGREVGRGTRGDSRAHGATNDGRIGRREGGENGVIRRHVDGGMVQGIGAMIDGAETYLRAIHQYDSSVTPSILYPRAASSPNAQIRYPIQQNGIETPLLQPSSSSSSPIKLTSTCQPIFCHAALLYICTTSSSTTPTKFSFSKQGRPLP